jgi:hypothetical protein
MDKTLEKFSSLLENLMKNYEIEIQIAIKNEKPVKDGKKLKTKDLIEEKRPVFINKYDFWCDLSCGSLHQDEDQDLLHFMDVVDTCDSCYRIKGTNIRICGHCFDNIDCGGSLSLRDGELVEL